MTIEVCQHMLQVIDIIDEFGSCRGTGHPLGAGVCPADAGEAALETLGNSMGN